MKRKNTEVILLVLSLIFYLAMSLTFLFMPLEEDTYVSGIVFWAGLAGGILWQILLSVSRKAFFRKNHISYKNAGKARIGLLRVFANTPAKIADIAFALFFVGTVIAMVATKGYGYVCYVFISLTVFSFVLHCIFNGRNFDFILNKSKICSILDKRYKQNYMEKERGRNDEK